MERVGVPGEGTGTWLAISEEGTVACRERAGPGLDGVVTWGEVG